jgi:hypothetical protein
MDENGRRGLLPHSAMDEPEAGFEDIYTAMIAAAPDLGDK